MVQDKKHTEKELKAIEVVTPTVTVFRESFDKQFYERLRGKKATLENVEEILGNVVMCLAGFVGAVLKSIPSLFEFKEGTENEEMKEALQKETTDKFMMHFLTIALSNNLLPDHMVGMLTGINEVLKESMSEEDDRDKRGIKGEHERGR